MNKKGFVFIEMIVTTVILIVALLVLYSTYSKIISNEKQRLYYDDIAYVYKAEKVRDVIASSVDYNNFYKNINNNENGYVYLFGPKSDIWQSNKMTSIGSTDFKNISLLWDEYGISAIGYVDIDNIKTLKQCFTDSSKLTGEDVEKCTATKTHLSSYSKSTIENYLKTIDVDYSKDATSNENEYVNHQAILIILFSEAKNGVNLSNSLTYSKCIQDNVLGTEKGEDGNIYYTNPYGFMDGYSIGVRTNSNLVETDDISSAIKVYNKNDKISFDMECENGYNIVWVYF